MGWEKDYLARLTTSDEAVGAVQSGWRVFSGQVSSYPHELEQALVRGCKRLRNVEIVHMFTLGPLPYCAPGLEEHFTYHTLYAAANSRALVQAGRAEFTPCYFYRIPQLYREKIIPLNAAMVQLSRPDENGMCSFGLNNEATKAAVESADVVLAEVNDQMPYVHGDNFIHVSQLDAIVETSYPLAEYTPPPVTDVERAIGEGCASLIEDGATLQLGIGGVPNAVLAALHGKRDLGLHTEMFSDGVIDLAETGVINGSRKALHKGEMVASFLMGTKRLFHFVHKNPKVGLYPVEYVNHPLTIMKNSKMVSVNSCVEMDFSGQMTSDTVGRRQISGVGGQVDFIRGAALAPGGKSIMAITSTAQGGQVSRIRPTLTPGALVTTTRHDVDYVVTEYGVVRLFGLTMRQRAKALISVAHPKFRDGLLEEYEKMFAKKEARHAQ